jgi:hypothetical protein
MINAPEGAWYYLLRRAARGLAGRQWSPLDQWVDVVEHRFRKNLSNLVHLCGLVGNYESAAMLQELDVDRMRLDFSIVHQKARYARSSSFRRG